MEKTPTTTLQLLPKIRQEINSLSIESVASHKYVTSQLGIFFGTQRKDEIVAKFQANYLILVNDPDVKKNIAGCDHFSMVQSLINLTKDNLSINPADKESCIVKYGTKAVGIPMWRGKLKRMQEKGVIRYLDYLEAVYKSDTFNRLGNGRYNHIPNTRPANDPIIGVLLIAIMPDGRERQKFVDAAAIEKRKIKSKMPNIWKEWPEEMYRKTTISIFESEIGVLSMHFSENNENAFIEDDPTQQEPDQQASYEDFQEAEYPEPEERGQNHELRSHLDNLLIQNPTILTHADHSRLLENIDSYDDEKLTSWIKAIEARIEEKKKDKTDAPF